MNTKTGRKQKNRHKTRQRQKGMAFNKCNAIKVIF